MKDWAVGIDFGTTNSLVSEWHPSMDETTLFLFWILG